MCVRVAILCAICRDSSVGILMGYGLDGRGSNPGRMRYFSLLHNFHTGSGTYPAFDTMANRGKAAAA
jgi:hypothetical protein